MSNTLSAIETRYAGCRFRSRLEARWAVFLDHLGITWQYEPQGYQIGPCPTDATPSGGSMTIRQAAYLPDFWLPDESLWVEVKGSAEHLSGWLTINAAIPHWGLPHDPSGTPPPDPSRAGRRLLILGPIPRPGGRTGHALLSFWKGDVQLDIAEFGMPLGLYETTSEPIVIGSDSGDIYPFGDLVTAAPLPGSQHPYIADAYTAARSARFEHGERG